MHQGQLKELENRRFGLESWIRQVCLVIEKYIDYQLKLVSDYSSRHYSVQFIVMFLTTVVGVHFIYCSYHRGYIGRTSARCAEDRDFAPSSALPIASKYYFIITEQYIIRMKL